MPDFRWNFSANYREATQAGATIHILNQQVNVLTQQTRKAEEQNTRYSRSWTRLAGIWNTWNKAVRFAVDDIKKLGAVLTGLFTKVRDVGGGFESAAAQIRGLLSEGADIAIEKAKELGATTMYTASQAASGLIELARAGFTGKEAAEALSPVLAAAQANAIDLAAAARIGAVGMNQFRASGEGVKDVLEILTAAAKESPTTILALGSAMKNAAPIAALLGINATKTATMLAMMAKSGLTAGRSGTMLRTSLERLAKSTPAGEKALARLGINLKRLDLSQPTQWIEVFRNALAKIPKESEQIALLKPIFGRAVTGILPIIQQGGAAFTEMEEKIIRSRKAMEEIKNLLSTTLLAAYNRLKSAIESVYVNLVDVIGLPIREYYNTLAAIVGKFSNRLKEVGKIFKEQATDLESWIRVVKEQGFQGLFQGLGEEIKPEIEKIKRLFEVAWVGIKALAGEIWDAIITPEVKTKVKNFAKEVGEAIVEGVKEGTGDVAVSIFGLGGVKKGYTQRERQAEQEEITTLVEHLDKMLTIKHEIEKTSVISKEDETRLKNANAQIKQAAEELQKLGWTPEQAGVKGAYYRAKIAGLGAPSATPSPSQQRNWREEQDVQDELQQAVQTERDKALQAYAEQQRRRGKEARAFMALPKEEQQAFGREAYIEALKAQQQSTQLSQEEMEVKGKLLDYQIQLTQSQEEYTQKVDESNIAANKLNLTIAKQESFLKKALLEPWDRFKQQLLSIREKFAELLEPLKQKKIDLFERLGLVKTPEAEQLRVKLQQESYQAAKKRLKLAQSPEEKARLYETLAERAGALYEAAPTGQQQYQQEAKRYIEQSIRNREEQQKLEEKKLALERELHLSTITELEAMTGKVKSPEQALEMAKQLQTSYLEIGKPLRAQEIQADILKLQREVAGRTNSLLERIIEKLELGLQLHRRQIDEHGSKLDDIRDNGGNLPYDPEMQAP